MKISEYPLSIYGGLGSESEDGYKLNQMGIVWNDIVGRGVYDIVGRGVCEHYKKN